MRKDRIEQITPALSTFASWLWSNWLLFVLFGVGVLYSAVTSGVRVRHFGCIMKNTLCEPFRAKNKGTDERE